MTAFHKLVRDHIPELIAANGDRAEVRVLEAAEFHTRLLKKLTEETAEYVEGRDPAELADVLEVVAALAETDGMSWETLLAIRGSKRRERGGFARRLLLVRTSPGNTGRPARPGGPV